MEPLQDAELNVIKHLIFNNTIIITMKYLLKIRSGLPTQLAFYIILGIAFELANNKDEDTSTESNS